MARVGTGMAFHPSAGAALHGVGHMESTCEQPCVMLCRYVFWTFTTQPQMEVTFVLSQLWLY